MVSSAIRRRSSGLREFIRGAVVAITAILATGMIFIGLTLFGIGYAEWPIGLTVGGAIALGMALFAFSDIRDEIAWNRVGGTLHDKCAHCKKPLGEASYIASPPPLRGVVHVTCLSKVMTPREGARAAK